MLKLGLVDGTSKFDFIKKILKVILDIIIFKFKMNFSIKYNCNIN